MEIQKKVKYEEELDSGFVEEIKETPLGTDHPQRKDDHQRSRKRTLI